MKVLFVCFVFALLAGSSISVPIESAEQAEAIDVADAVGVSETEDKVRAKKSTEVNHSVQCFSVFLSSKILF